MMLEARFEHSCDSCTLFAATENGDWYVCATPHRERTVLLRYADEVSKYTSLTINGSNVKSALILGALTLGLRFTDNEARHFLASLLVHELPRPASQYTPDDVDQPYGAIFAAVLE